MLLKIQVFWDVTLSAWCWIWRQYCPSKQQELLTWWHGLHPRRLEETERRDRVGTNMPCILSVELTVCSNVLSCMNFSFFLTVYSYIPSEPSRFDWKRNCKVKSWYFVLFHTIFLGEGGVTVMVTSQLYTQLHTFCWVIFPKFEVAMKGCVTFCFVPEGWWWDTELHHMQFG